MSRTDEEEVEQLKNLWQDYGKPVIAGVVITLVAVFGYKAYKQNQYETSAAASQLYQSLLDASASAAQGQSLTEQQKSTVQHVAETLKADYSGSRYAAYAMLQQARVQVQSNDLDGARASLQWVVDQNTNQETELLARTRLARVMLGQSADNAQAALDVLAAASSEAGFVATIEAVRGDALLAKGDRDSARAAYQKALDAAQANGEARPLLQFKLDDLAVKTTEG
ncbi:hypothetical protein EOPP23_19025 [Endozoicomonas sp. OPT23]|uniref:YfgM family protein n=1 Tax=Endozoicomonas sp. OPT23 TaxID=2072845 RepID=UPI00129BD581|nr:hypothetical protein [Endozoicomonas sp. OPT23]